MVGQWLALLPHSKRSGSEPTGCPPAALASSHTTANTTLIGNSKLPVGVNVIVIDCLWDRV